MFVQLTLVASCVILAFVYGVTGKIDRRKSKKKNFPPGPIGLPYFGVSLSINTDKLHLHFCEWKQQYGDIVMTKMMGKHIVVINSPELLRRAFVSEELSPLLNDRPLNFIGDVILYGYKDILLRRNDDDFRAMKTLLKRCMSKYGFLSPHFQSLAEREFKTVVQQFKDTEGRAFYPMDILMPSFCTIIGMFVRVYLEEIHSYG